MLLAGGHVLYEAHSVSVTHVYALHSDLQKRASKQVANTVLPGQVFFWTILEMWAPCYKRKWCSYWGELPYILVDPEKTVRPDILRERPLSLFFFPVAWMKHPERNNLWEKEFVLTHSPSWPEVEVTVARISGSWPCSIHSEETGQWMLPSGSSLSPSSTAQDPCHLVKVGLPTSINAIKMLSHRRAQRPISQEIIDPVKLTIDTSHPILCSPARHLGPLLLQDACHAEAETEWNNYSSPLSYSRKKTVIKEWIAL